MMLQVELGPIASQSATGVAICCRKGEDKYNLKKGLNQEVKMNTYHMVRFQNTASVKTADRGSTPPPHAGRAAFKGIL